MNASFGNLLKQLGYDRPEQQPEKVRDKLEKALYAFQYSHDDKKNVFLDYVLSRGNIEKKYQNDADTSVYNRNPALIAGTLFGLIVENEDITLEDVVTNTKQKHFLKYLGNESRGIRLQLRNSGSGLGRHSVGMQITSYEHTGSIFDGAIDGEAYVSKIDTTTIATNSRNCVVYTPGMKFIDGGTATFTLEPFQFDSTINRVGINQAYTIEQLHSRLSQLQKEISPYFTLEPLACMIPLDDKTIIAHHNGIEESAKSIVFRNMQPDYFKVDFRDTKGRIALTCYKGNLTTLSTLNQIIQTAGTGVGLGTGALFLAADAVLGGALTLAGGAVIGAKLAANHFNTNRGNGMIVSVQPQAYNYSKDDIRNYQLMQSKFKSTS